MWCGGKFRRCKVRRQDQPRRSTCKTWWRTTRSVSLSWDWADQCTGSRAVTATPPEKSPRVACDIDVHDARVLCVAYVSWSCRATVKLTSSTTISMEVMVSTGRQVLQVKSSAFQWHQGLVGMTDINTWKAPRPIKDLFVLGHSTTAAISVLEEGVRKLVLGYISLWQASVAFAWCVAIVRKTLSKSRAEEKSWPSFPAVIRSTTTYASVILQILHEFGAVNAGSCR